MTSDGGIIVEFNMICPGKRLIGKAGCELTWEYLFPNREMPAAVSFLGRYDVWDLQGSVLPFQYGMRLNNTWPDNQEMWQKFLKQDDDETTMLNVDTIRQGETILKYQDQENEKYCKSCAFEVQFEGFKAIAVNKLLTSSQLFKSVWNKEKYDIMITFGLRSNGMWTMSFYTDKEGIDCSLLAKKLGGGGHKQAAGCNFEELPIEFLRQVKKLLPVKEGT
jgi:oligoribonuclease NrnB/cAMP/cGMP phosphodiesterase (DHH superfamily)